MKILENLKTNINKFSIAQATSNSEGKTSGSGTAGLLICFIGAITFAYATFTKQMETINQSVMFTTLGAGLLGYRKSKDAAISTEQSSQTSDVITTEDTTTNTETPQ